MQNSSTLYELNEYLKRVIALNFQEPIWISCEISQVSEVRGQVYMDVVQQDETTNEIIAQASAVIWYKSYLFLKSKLKELLPSILSLGTHVLLKVKVDFHERYGVKLVIEDIDPSYTIGQMEMARQKILQKLADTGTMDNNGSMLLPRVLQSIAVISSATAAGYKDFIAQLTHNEYGYKIKSTLFQAAMQGQNVEREVCSALDEIDETQYDCVVIIRGGGSKLDLSGFDNFNIGYKIATYSLPVFTGIGHEIDQSVADLVAHTSFKTPTAVASFIIDQNLNFESEVVSMGQWIGQQSKQLVSNHKSLVDQHFKILQLQPKYILQDQETKLNQLHTSFSQQVKFTIKEISEKLYHTDHIIKLADPINTLKRGYVMIKSNNKNIVSIKNLTKGDHVELHYHDGTKSAEILN